MELIALVKHDCPVCDQVLPALDAARAAGAPVRILSQSSAQDTAAQATRLGLSATPELDEELIVSVRLDPEAVPAVVLLDGEAEQGRVEGLHRERLGALASRAGATLELDGLPATRPGCASLTRDPEVAVRLAARAARADGRLRSRTLEVGGLEDPVEALHERGLTDGLPVVLPTPERVVTMLAGSSRHPQDPVGTVPPYDGVATVEKVAINAVMAGCPPEVLPVVLAAVEAACVPGFALHGLVATTHPAGPAVIVSGPLAAAVGMNAGGNCLGQGSRANATIGRALQLTVRNLGGGRPGIEDRAAHGQPGKLGLAFAERIEDSPWEPLAQEHGLPGGETGVTLMALEAPRIVVDQLSRDPEGLCETFSRALAGASNRRQRLGGDALLVIGPEHARVFRAAGWSKPQLRAELFERTSADGETFAAPERIGLVHAGGDAGLFSMLFGTWVSGERGSVPVTRSVEPWR